MLIYVLMPGSLADLRGHIGREDATVPERIIQLCMIWVTKGVNRMGVGGTDTAASLGKGPMTWEAVGAMTLVGFRIPLEGMGVVVLGLTFLKGPRGRGDPLRVTLRNRLLHCAIDDRPRTVHEHLAVVATARRCLPSALPAALPVLAS